MVLPELIEQLKENLSRHFFQPTKNERRKEALKLIAAVQ